MWADESGRTLRLQEHEASAAVMGCLVVGTSSPNFMDTVSFLNNSMTEELALVIHGLLQL